MSLVHVIGAGLAGLACAVRVTLAGREVALYEAAPQAGGRARSFHDDSIGRLIDNGSHMLMGANSATKDYIADISGGATDNGLAEIAPARFPFLDLSNGERWTLRPGSAIWPTWLLDPSRRVPRTRPRDYLEALRLSRAAPDATVRDVLGVTGALYERFWQPLCRAALNTDAAEASAQLVWRLMASSFLKGEAACRPLVFTRGLSPTLIDPALETLRRHGAELRFKARLRGLEWSDGRVIGLHFPEGVLRVKRGDLVVLAVPPNACAELWPQARVPQASRAIVNAHFRLPERVQLPESGPFLGLIGAESHWLFARGEILSVTVSAADHLLERPNWDLANMFWAECAKALGRQTRRLPPWRIIKERRATFAQTPTELTRRSGADTALDNLFLAGDWTDTGLPATIESATRSGFAAARQVLATLEATESAAKSA